MKDIHPIKIDILKKLLFADSMKFSEIKPHNMEGSQFTFHIEDLIKNNLVEKNSQGEYLLTKEGKNIANRYDFDSEKPNIQAKHSVIVAATRNGKKEILIYTRLKNPFFGCQGFMTGKVQYGESIVDTAKRELFEETKLIGEPKLKGIRHYRVYDKTTKKFLEDKVMYIHVAEEPTGELKSNIEGSFKWIKVNDVKKVVLNPLEEFEESLEVVLGNAEFFKEVNHFTDKF